jgi:hypothetical protein
MVSSIETKLPPRRQDWTTWAVPLTSTSRLLVRSAAAAVAGGRRRAKRVVDGSGGDPFCLTQAATYGLAAGIVTTTCSGVAISSATCLVRQPGAGGGIKSATGRHEDLCHVQLGAAL